MQLQVTEPTNYRVFQQDAHGQAAIKVVAEGAAPGGQVKARLVLLPGYAGRDGDWTALTEDQGVFSGQVLGAAGGWYKLEVQATGPDSKTRKGSVAHIGVGEVLVTAGQSNAANSGETPQKPSDDRVVAFDGKVWKAATDPQPIATGEGGSPWPHLGDLLARHLQVPVGFVSVAVGGSHTFQWLPDTGEFFPRLLQAVQPLGRQGARVLLWHQGESDTIDKTSAEEYARRLTVIMQALDKELGWRLPWMVAQAAYGYGPDFPEAQQEQVRQGQRLLWERGRAFQGPLTDDLTGPTYRANQDGAWIHFNATGLQTVAERWFAMLWAQLYAYPYLG
jgi:hypothetical protein